MNKFYLKEFQHFDGKHPPAAPIFAQCAEGE